MAKKKSRTALSKAKVAPPRVAAKLTPAGNTMDVIDGGDQVRTASQKLAGDLRRGRVFPGKEGSVLQGSLTVPARGFYTAILIFSLTVGFLVIAGSAWDLVFGTHQLRR